MYIYIYKAHLNSGNELELRLAFREMKKSMYSETPRTTFRSHYTLGI